MSNSTILEISVECDAEAAEAVSELFNRFNGGDYDADSEAGEASGGGAVIETTGYDDFNEPIAGEFRHAPELYRNRVISAAGQQTHVVPRQKGSRDCQESCA